MAGISLGEIFAVLKLRDDLSPALKIAGRNLTQTGTQLKMLGSSVSQAGQAMLPLSIAIAGVGAISVKVFSEFQSKMNRVRAVTGATGDDFKALEAQAKQLGATTVFTARQSAEAMGFLGLAGFKTTEIIGAMPRVLQLAAAAQLEVGEAADITAKTMRGYGLEVKELGRVNDVMVKAFTTSNTDLRQLGDAFRMAGPVAKVAGIKFEETAAALSLMADAGFQGTLGGTALRNTMARLAGATPAVTKQLAEMGITTTNSAKELIPLVDILSQLEKRGLSAGEVMALFGQRAGPAMAALIERGSDALRTMTASLEDSAGTAERIQRIQLEGLKGQFILMKSAVEGVGLALGAALEPAVTVAVDAVRRLALWVRDTLIPAFNALPDPIKAATAALAGLVAVGGPVLIALGGSIRLLGFALGGLGMAADKLAVSKIVTWLTGGLRPAVTALFSPVATVTRLWGVLATLLGSAALPITLLVAAIVGLVAWLAKWTAVGDSLKAALSETKALLGDVVPLIKDTARTAVSLAVDGFGEAVKFGRNLVETLGALTTEFQAFNPVVGFAKGAVDLFRLALVAAKVEVILMRAQLNAIKELTGQAERERNASSSGQLASSFTSGRDEMLAEIKRRGKERLDAQKEFDRALEDERRAAAGDAARIAGASSEAFQEAFKAIKAGFGQSITDAKAWVAVLAGRDIRNVGPAIREGVGGALRAVVDNFGSLKAAGLEAFQGILLASQAAGTGVFALGQQISALTLGFSMDKGSLFDQMFAAGGGALENKLKFVNAGDFASTFNLKETPEGIRNPSKVQDAAKSFFEQMATARNDSNRLNFIGGPDQESLFKVPPSVGTPAQTSVLTRSLKGFAAGMPAVMMQALTGGGDVGKSVGALFGNQLGSSMSESIVKKVAAKQIGAKVGGIIGSAFPVIGTLIGSFIGKGLGALTGALFGSKGRDEVKKFAESMGGFDALRKQMDSLGAEGERLWKRLTQGVGKNDKKAAEKAIKDIQEAFAKADALMKKYGLSLDDIGKASEKFGDKTKELIDDMKGLEQLGFTSTQIGKAMAGPLNEMLRVAIETGKKIPDALKPMILELARAGLIADDVRKKLLGIQDVPWEKMIEVAERYGISLEALGPAFRQAKLSATAEEIAADFDLLITNGADLTAVLDGMAPAVNKVVQEALRLGLEIPASMKPVIASLIASKQLFDENGELITDISQIKFSESITQAIDRLILALEELFGKTAEGFRDMAQEIADTPIIFKTRQEQQDASGGGPREVLDDAGNPVPRPTRPSSPDGYAHGTRGQFHPFAPGGELATLHGDEAITPRGGGASLADEVAVALGPLLGGGGKAINLTVQTMDARSFQTWLATGGADQFLKYFERNDGIGAVVSPRARLQAVAAP